MEPWLEEHCTQLLAGIPSDRRLDLLAAYDTHICFKPTSADVPYLDRVLVVASTGGTGSCGCPHGSVAVDLTLAVPTWLGPSNSLHSCLDVAVVDALLRPLVLESGSWVDLEGSVHDKARMRAQLLVSAVLERLEGPRARRQGEVLVVGAVGSVIEALRGRGLTVHVTEMDPTLIGQTLSGVEVQPSAATMDLVRNVDCALVTGMTVATQTLGPVLDAAREGRTPLVFYAQSAVNILKTVEVPTPTTIVNEEFPHYMWPGLSRVEVSTAASTGRKAPRRIRSSHE